MDFRRASLVALSICLAFGSPAASAADETPAHRAPDRIVVGFAENAEVRLRGNHLVSIAGLDTRELERVLRRHGHRETDRLFARDELSIECTRRAAQARTEERLPDLNSYFELTVEPGRSEALLEELARLPIVRVAYRAPLPTPPPVDIPPTTPDGEPDQGYIEAAPIGIDARYAWTRPGGRGAGMKIVDIEYDWRDTHEDLETAFGRQECFTPGTPSQIEHGTAVLGELIGGNNGYGVTGISSDVTVGLVTNQPVSMTYNVARAIDCATGLMSAGDVLLIEAQTGGPFGNFVPVEWDQAEYDSIVVAVASGIIVVEAAGNGNENLDDPAFNGAFDRAMRDSGAIIVGAGAPPDYGTQAARSRLDFSTYGSRVDLQGWGDDVITTGYGDVFDGGGDPNQYYTELFSGTSSASPMIAGAAAIIGGVQLACGGPPLAPTHIRQILTDTGTPQTAGPYAGNIGPQPDLLGALALVDSDNDLDGFAECQGDCDDGELATHPGAAESNDGLDNQCPGEPGYGAVDETSGDCGFHNAGDKSEYSWTAQPGATRYAVARSDSPQFSSGCQSWETTSTSISDGVVPAAGAAFFYLTRPVLPLTGSWGLMTAGGERTGVCL